MESLIPKPEVPVWKGPVHGGISQSIINGFQCPFRAYLKLILGLRDFAPLHKNLVWGDCYHVGLEHLIRGDSLMEAKVAAIDRLKQHDTTQHNGQFTFNEDQKWEFGSYRSTIGQMLSFYDLSILPQGEWVTEHTFTYNWSDGFSAYKFLGKFDGWLKNECLVEHKCKGFYSIDPDLLQEEIETDLQAILYMTVAQVETIYYDLIGIPESASQFKKPYQAKGKSHEQYGIELVLGGVYKNNGVFPVKDNTHVWFSQRPYFISQETQEAYFLKTILPKVKRIHEWYEYVTDSKFDPNNPDCYNQTFYIEPVRSFVQSNTEKFKCDYHGFLTNQISLSQLVPTQTVFPELELNE